MFLFKFNKIIFLVISLGLFKCYGQTQNSSAPNTCSITVNTIKDKLLGKTIADINHPWRPCFQQKNILIRDEEQESLSWNALVFSRDHKKAFVAEGNWKDGQQISRITILDKQIPTSSGIQVGDSFEQIKALVAPSIPSGADGFLSLQDKDDPDIFYTMDIRKYPELFYGVDRLSEIPGPVKVESIVVMKH